MEKIELPEGSRWTILERAEDYKHPSNGSYLVRYKCVCLCGKEKIVHRISLLNGDSRSCGCLQREICTIHGGRVSGKSREYAAWSGMKTRVKSKSERNRNYQGVEICQRWLNSFKNFLDDLGTCPDNYELERIDHTLGYFHENCCWASETRQAQNKGDYRNNTSGFKGVTWSPQHSKWRVGLQRNKKRYEGGLYESLEEAAEARQRLEILHPMEDV